MSSKIPKTGTRSTVASSISSFLKNNPDLHLGGDVDFHTERRHHIQVFGFHALPKDKQASIGKVEFYAVRGPHGTIPIRLFYPKAVVDGNSEKIAALVYMHGGGYTVGSVDEFENGLRLLAENSGAIVCFLALFSRCRDDYRTARRLASNTVLPRSTISQRSWTSIPPLWTGLKVPKAQNGASRLTWSSAEVTLQAVI